MKEKFAASSQQINKSLKSKEAEKKAIADLRLKQLRDQDEKKQAVTKAMEIFRADQEAFAAHHLDELVSAINRCFFLMHFRPNSLLMNRSLCVEIPLHSLPHHEQG